MQVDPKHHSDRDEALCKCRCQRKDEAMLNWGFPKIGVPLLGVPLRGVYSIWGIIGVPLCWEMPNDDVEALEVSEGLIAQRVQRGLGWSPRLRGPPPKQGVARIGRMPGTKGCWLRLGSHGVRRRFNVRHSIPRGAISGGSQAVSFL